MKEMDLKDACQTRRGIFSRLLGLVVAANVVKVPVKGNVKEVPQTQGTAKTAERICYTSQNFYSCYYIGTRLK